MPRIAGEGGPRRTTCNQASGATPNSRRELPAAASWCTCRPGDGDAAQRFDVDLGVNLRGVWLAMPQKLSDLGERRPLSQQVGGQGMTKQVCAVERRSQAGAFERPSDDAIDAGRAGETAQRCSYAKKKTPCPASRTDVA